MFVVYFLRIGFIRIVFDISNTISVRAGEGEGRLTHNTARHCVVLSSLIVNVRIREASYNHYLN